MSYTLSNLLVDLLGSLGQSENFLATGGSSNTAVNSTIAQRLGRKPKKNYAVDGTLFVVRDAGGAGAAPEGEFQRVYLYNPTTWTYTTDANFSAAIAAGDELMLVPAEFFGREAIRRVNAGLQKLSVALVDTSLVTVSGQAAYALPVIAKRERPLMVEIQETPGDDNSYEPFNAYDYVPAAGGSTGILMLRGSFCAGATIRVTYRGEQPALTVFNSVIHETIHPALALAAAKVAILEWYVASNEDADFWLQQINIARTDLEDARRAYPVWKPTRTQRYFSGPV